MTVPIPMPLRSLAALPGTTQAATLPLRDAGTTWTMAQEAAFLDDTHYAVGRWDGTLSLRVYADACITPTSQGVGAVFTALTKWVTRHSREDVRETLVQLVAESAEEWRSDGSADAHLRWLPAPDPSVTGRSIWMLPGLSSLTNIYARLNLYRRGRLADVRLVHDEHMLYGCILQDAKRLMEELAAADAVPMVPHADYALREHTELEFRSSADTPGIQAADVIGGFVMRYARDALAGRSPSRDRVAAMARILALSRPEEARGLNFVTSGRLMAAMGVPWV